MGDIFICHSRHDHDLVVFVNEVCANAGVRAREFEFNFSALGRTANEEIVTIMQECSVLFVLLGRNIVMSRHTSNWVSSEVGLAKGMNIPIWVMEDWFTPIDFPVPFVDHYLRVNIGDPAHRDPEHHGWMQALLSAYGSRRPRSGDINIPETQYLQCGNGGCQAIFAIHQSFDHIKKCPVCSWTQEWKELPQPSMSE
jgi:hypothetical protein